MRPLGNLKTQYFHCTTHFFYDSDILTLRYTQLLHMRIHIFDDSTHVLLCCLQKGYSTHQTLISKVQYLFLYHFNFSTDFTTYSKITPNWRCLRSLDLIKDTVLHLKLRVAWPPWFLERSTSQYLFPFHCSCKWQKQQFKAW